MRFFLLILKSLHDRLFSNIILKVLKILLLCKLDRLKKKIRILKKQSIN
jgi:hypothetical protein